MIRHYLHCFSSPSSLGKPLSQVLVKLCAGATLLGLSACSSVSESPTSYLLPSPTLEQQATTQYQDKMVVMVAPVRISGHLDSDGIVMQLNDIEVYQARQHLWAEDISVQLQQQLQQRLSQVLPNAQVISKGQPVQGQLPLRELRLQISRFQGQTNGEAVVAGQWQLLNDAGQLIKQANFSRQQQLTDDGYPALVRALGHAWSQQADALASEIQGIGE